VFLENYFNVTGVVAEAAVIGLLLYRRVGRRLPLFVVYCITALVTDIASFLIRVYFPAWYGINYYLAESTLDFVLQFCVLVEIAWAVLQPVRRFLSHRAVFLIAALILAFCAILWPFAGLTQITPPTRVWGIVMHMQQAVSIVRVLFFVVLAASSQLLSLGWRDRELQVATGFGFYSLVSLGIAVVNTHQSTAQQFRDLYLFIMLAFVITLIYWVFCFAQKEPPRRGFTPNMQENLLALARIAHVTRDSLSDPDSRKPDDDPPEEP